MINDMKYKILLLFCLLNFTACNSWLDVDLANKVDEEKLFSKPDGFLDALAGVYSQMSKTPLYGRTLTMGHIDLFAQYYSYNSMATSYQYYRDYDYQSSVVLGTFTAIWRNMYACIASVNNILAWEEKNGGVMTGGLRDRVKGEALALRAFLHFDLYRMFCADVTRGPKNQGIPYNKEFGVSLPPMYTVEEVVQLVINDLEEAEKLLVNDEIKDVIIYQLGSKDQADEFVARVNKYTVKALLARVHQARGDKKNAIKYAEEVINAPQFRLLNFGSIDQAEQMTDVLFSDEHLFSLRNKELPDLSRAIHYAITHESGSWSPAQLPFENVNTLYEGNNDDVRYTKWFNAGNFVKWVTNNTGNFFPKMPLIKLSEMYLLLADCYYASDHEKALGYINTLRDHRIRNNVHWYYLTEEYIFEEMCREYLGEGQLWFVYKRKNKEIPTSGIVGTISPGDHIFVFPIPMQEIEKGYRENNQ